MYLANNLEFFLVFSPSIPHKPTFYYLFGIKFPSTQNTRKHQCSIRCYSYSVLRFFYFLYSTNRDELMHKAVMPLPWMQYLKAPRKRRKRICWYRSRGNIPYNSMALYHSSNSRIMCLPSASGSPQNIALYTTIV